MRHVAFCDGDTKHAVTRKIHVGDVGVVCVCGGVGWGVGWGGGWEGCVGGGGWGWGRDVGGWLLS